MGSKTLGSSLLDAGRVDVDSDQSTADFCEASVQPVSTLLHLIPPSRGAGETDVGDGSSARHLQEEAHAIHRTRAWKDAGTSRVFDHHGESSSRPWTLPSPVRLW
jgi:hypothetical protein